MKFKLLHINFLLAIACCFANGTFGQTIKVTADRNSIYLGEQLNVTISVQNIVPGTGWFQLPDSIGHLEVISKSKIDTAANGSSINLTQTLKITSFDSGRWQFPSLLLPGMQPSAAIAIEVLPVDVSQMQDYHDIKDIELVEAGTNWLIVIVIAIVTLLAIAAMFWLLRKKQAVATPKNEQSPYEWALAEMAKLQQPGQLHNAGLQQYYNGLNYISRVYFQRTTGIATLQQTTDEWMISLQPIAVEHVIKTSFFQFLRLADIVKFARYMPPVHESETAFEAVKNMLYQMHMQHSGQHVKYQPT